MRSTDCGVRCCNVLAVGSALFTVDSAIGSR